MRLLVCGGRDYADRAFITECLDKARAKRPITLLLHTGKPGAEMLAATWAWGRGIRDKALEPDAMMAEGKPDGVVAFPGDTAHMVGLAIDAGLPVWYPVRKGS